MAFPEAVEMKLHTFTKEQWTKMLPSSWSALTLSPPLSHLLLAISLPLPSLCNDHQCRHKFRLPVWSVIVYFGGGECPTTFQLQRYNPQWNELQRRRGGGCSTAGVFTNPLFNPYVILSMNIVWYCQLRTYTHIYNLIWGEIPSNSWSWE